MDPPLPPNPLHHYPHEMTATTSSSSSSSSITRVAQARRRQRVMNPMTTGTTTPTGGTSSSSSTSRFSSSSSNGSFGTTRTTSATTPPVPSTTTIDHRTTNVPPLFPPPPSYDNHNDDNIMNQSMEVGDHVASLLASIRKEQRQQQQRQQQQNVDYDDDDAEVVVVRKSTNTTTSTSNNNNHHHHVTFATKPTLISVDTNNVTTTTASMKQAPSSSSSLQQQRSFKGATTTTAAAANNNIKTTKPIATGTATATAASTTTTNTTIRTTTTTIAPLSISYPQEQLLSSSTVTSSLSKLHKATTNSTNIGEKIDLNVNTGSDSTIAPPCPYIANHSVIRIQSYAYPMQTISVTTFDKNSNSSNNHIHLLPSKDVLVSATNVATLNGNFLHDPIELVKFIAVRPPTATIQEQHVHEASSLWLYLNDIVMIQWNTTFALTCCSTASNTNHPQVQFLPIINSNNNNNIALQHWKIISVSETTSIKVGRVALEEDAIERVSNARNITPDSSTKIPIQIYDRIVLRNCGTGGILSCTKDGNLRVITDGSLQPQIDITSMMIHEDDDDNNYEMEQPQPHQHRMIIDRKYTSPMTQIQQSNHLVPSKYEIFVILHESIPALPLWVQEPNIKRLTTATSRTNTQYTTVPPFISPSITESYMSMSYLLYPDRFEQMNGMILSNVFPNFHDAAAIPNKSTNKNVGDNDNTITENHPVFETIHKQEQVLLLELINVCMGLEGRYIRAIAVPNATMDEIQFHLCDDVNERWDTIVRRLIEDMLLLPTLFVRIQSFISRHTPGYEYGITMQVFCEALGQIVHDYIGTVVGWYQQYTNKVWTISKFQLQIQSSIQTLSMLYQICHLIQNRKGGVLINVIRHYLHTTVFNGNTDTERVVKSLLNATAVPYIQRFLEWVEMGILSDDPYHEFLVEKNNDPMVSWENQYNVSTMNKLEGFFLTDQLLQQALDAGRYWNAVGACKRNTSNMMERTGTSSKVATIQYSSSTTAIGAFIKENYLKASKSLLQLLLVDFNLLHELNIMKRYFLLDHGEFFVNFLEYAEDELLKDITQVSRGKIQHWIDNCRYVVNQSDDDTYVKPMGAKSIADSIRCRFSNDGLSEYLDKLHAASGGIDTKEAWTPMRHTYGGTLASTKGDLTGLDTFYLDLSHVEFPISTVLSSSAMGYYHLLFRHLFLTKYVERRMVSIWTDHQMLKELKSLRKLMGPTFLLRQRMLHVLQNLLYYTMFEVIEPNWLIMENSIRSSMSNTEHTVDDVIKYHSQFLHRTVEACLLTNRDVVRALTKLMKTCLLFSEQMKRFMRATKLEDERFSVATEKHQELQNNFYSQFSKRTLSLGPTKHIQEHFLRNRKERMERVQRQSARIEREVSSDAYRRMITRFEEVFTKNLRDFMIQINNSDDIYHTHKVNLCIRLDYNGYISDSLGLV